MKKSMFFAVVAAYCLVLSSCGAEKEPFEARYTSRNEVVVTYEGQEYSLNRYLPSTGLPFEYSFEADGDLDLVIDGREYEVDSPYDIDVKKKTKSTVFSKKKSGSSVSKKKNSTKKYMNK